MTLSFSIGDDWQRDRNCATDLSKNGGQHFMIENCS